MTPSVVIPAKNEARCLPRLLAALARQRQSVQIVVAVAPGGDHWTGGLCAAPDVSIVEGGTPAQARNAGARAATGDPLLFLDADVLPTGADFVTQACAALNTQELDVATVGYRSLEPALRERFFYGLVNVLQSAGTRIGRPSYLGCCLVVRRDAHDLLSGFDERIAFAEDYDYVTRARRCGLRIGLLPGIDILADGRRIRDYGLGRTLLAGLRAASYRQQHGEIEDLAIVDPHYFERREAPAGAVDAGLGSVDPIAAGASVNDPRLTR